MAMSLTTLLTFTLCTSLCMALTCCLCQSRVVKKIGIYAMLTFALVIAARMFFPFEMPFTVNIPVEKAYTVIVTGLRRPIADIGSVSISGEAIALGIWIIGSAAAIIVRLCSEVKLSRMLSTGCINAGKDKMALFQNALSEMGCKASMKLYQSYKIRIPFARGAIRTKVYIPDIELSDKQWQMIFRHEIMHSKLGDIWVKIALETLTILYWWNPLVYLFRRSISKLLEMRVDHSVTRTLERADQKEYMNSLLNVAEYSAAGGSMKIWSRLALDGNDGGTLEERIKFIKERGIEDTRKNRHVMLASTVFALLLSFSTCLFVFEPYGVPPDSALVSYTISDESSYIIVNADGYYDIYIDNNHIATSIEIRDSFSNLRIYENGKVEN